MIGQGIVYLCDHAERIGTFSYDDDTDWSMLTENMTYWILDDLREPDPIPVEPTPQPSPQPGPRP